MSSRTSTDQNRSQHISLKEASRILNVHPETLRRWDNSGKLKAIRVGPRQDRKYSPADIVKALEQK